MSYAVSTALQKAVYSALGADVALQVEVGGAIYDAMPQGAVPDLFVSLGSEAVKTRSDISGSGSQHDLTVSVVAAGEGFSAAKAVAGMVSDVLNGADLALERGELVFMRFLKASAKRNRGASGRRIDMIFRARVDDI